MVIDGPWDIAVGTYPRFSGVHGTRTGRVRAVNAYLNRLHLAAERDPEVGEAFLRVVNLIDRPERLLAPSVTVRVLAAGRAEAARPGRSAAAVSHPSGRWG